MVADQFLDCLTAIAANACNGPRRRHIGAEGRALVEQAREELNGPALEQVEHRFARFVGDMGAMARREGEDVGQGAR